MVDKDVEKLTGLLTEVLKTIQMKNASFGDINPNKKVPVMIEGEVTDFISERTRNWRASWIECPIKRALKILEKYENQNDLINRTLYKVSEN